MVQLPVRNGQRRAGEKDALGPGRKDAHAVGDALLELVGELVGHLGAASRVVEERDLRHEQGVLAGNGDAVRGLAALVDACERAALGVDGLDGGGEVVDRQLAAGELLDHLREIGDLARPLLNVLRALHLRHVHDVGGLVGAEDLVGLLLAVAGGLAHVHVGHAEVRARMAEVRAERGLHQRAHAGGQHLFTGRHPELAAAAQPRDRAAACDDDLVGNVDAEGAEDLAAGFLQLDELLRADAVDVADDEIVERHVLGAVFLGQVHVAERLRQHRAELIVRLQVHSKAFPKVVTIGHDASFSGRAPPRPEAPRLICAASICRG